MRRLILFVVTLAVAAASLGLPAPSRAAPPITVAVIVGPVGEELTPVYLGLAEAAAVAAETRGATVRRAYSPDASAENVLAAVDGANIVVYFGHGIGTPNPYSDVPDPATTNGWGLNGPNARGDHSDSWSDGTIAYYGETWIAEHARPAPGWVMIYSNACYAPGASEGFDTPATEDVAVSRVAAYSRAPLAEMGASAYFATDYFEGAAHLVGALIDRPESPYAEIFSSEPRFIPDGVSRHAIATLEGAEAWLHRSAYFDGKVDYWYAFAGNPAGSLSGTLSAVPAPAAAAAAAAGGPSDDHGVVTGRASSYAESAGHEGEATVALPVEIGVPVVAGQPASVVVCAERCATLPVVDSCPCYFGTADQRVANLSHAAWALVSDMPLEEGLIDVQIQLSPMPTIRGGAPTS